VPLFTASTSMDATGTLTCLPRSKLNRLAVVCGQCQAASPGHGTGDVVGHLVQAPALPQPAAVGHQVATAALRWAVGPGLRNCSSKGTATWMETAMGRRAKA